MQQTFRDDQIERLNRHQCGKSTVLFFVVNLSFTLVHSNTFAALKRIIPRPKIQN